MIIWGPSPGPPGEVVILYKLVEEVNAPHVVVVVADNCRALHRDLFVPRLPTTSDLPPFDDFLEDGLMTCGYHGHETHALPAYHEYCALAAPLGLSTRKKLLVRAKPFEDSKSATHQPKGATHVNTVIIQFLGQPHRIIIVIHKQVISLITEPPYESKNGITEGLENPGIH